MDSQEPKPRQHDNLVEPLYAGLQQEAEPKVLEKRHQRGLWIAWIAGALAVASLALAAALFLGGS